LNINPGLKNVPLKFNLRRYTKLHEYLARRDRRDMKKSSRMGGGGDDDDDDGGRPFSP
jgi:hypothetical protein